MSKPIWATGSSSAGTGAISGDTGNSQAPGARYTANALSAGEFYTVIDFNEVSDGSASETRQIEVQWTGAGNATQNFTETINTLSGGDGDADGGFSLILDGDGTNIPSDIVILLTDSPTN